MQQTGQTWRSLLGELTGTTRERQRVANAMNVSSMTVTRWVKGESDPRPQNFPILLSLFPQHRSLMFLLLSEEFGDAFKASLEATGDVDASDVPAPFYAEVIKEFLSVSEDRRFRAVGPSILRQAIEQLDPNQQGIAIVVVGITPPAKPQGVARSLHSVLCAGSGMWSSEGIYNNAFHGAESLCGYAIAQTHPQTIQSVTQEHEGQLPVLLIDEVGSGTAFPIQRSDRVGGSVLVWSSQQEYFTSPRLRLIEQYANLLALAKDPQAFYEPQNILLEILPPPDLQQPLLSSFRQRLMTVLRESAQQQHTLSIPQAERVVFSQIETELIALGCSGQSKLVRA